MNEFLFAMLWFQVLYPGFWEGSLLKIRSERRETSASGDTEDEWQQPSEEARVAGKGRMMGNDEVKGMLGTFRGVLMQRNWK